MKNHKKITLILQISHAVAALKEATDILLISPKLDEERDKILEITKTIEEKVKAMIG